MVPGPITGREGSMRREARLDELAGVLRIASVLVEEIAEEIPVRGDADRLRRVAVDLCDGAGEIEMVLGGTCARRAGDRAADAPCR